MYQAVLSKPSRMEMSLALLRVINWQPDDNPLGSVEGRHQTAWQALSKKLLNT
jgi:hypothetical protein